MKKTKLFYYSTGILCALTLFIYKYENNRKVNINDIPLKFCKFDGFTIKIDSTNLETVEIFPDLENKAVLILSNNLLTNIDSLNNTSDLLFLDITNNSIDNLDMSKYKKIEYLNISGNYELYREELLDYCNENNILIDITNDDIECILKIKNILKNLDLDNLSEIEKEKKIYKYVLDLMTYDTNALDNEKLIYEYNTNVLNHALNGKGVCINYAALFDAMCDLSGIDSFLIYGYSYGCAHAWNLVKINGEYYLCDPTFSDTFVYPEKDSVIPLFEEEDFFFNIKDEAYFYENHEEATLESINYGKKNPNYKTLRTSMVKRLKLFE